MSRGLGWAFCAGSAAALLLSGCGQLIFPEPETDFPCEHGGYLTFFQDGDGDGFGDESTATQACESPGEGWVSAAGDCDDEDPERAPGLIEICDGFDNDCDLLVDNASTLAPLFRDLDGDGWGAEGVILESCLQGDGWTDQPGDCDDLDPRVYPGAPESPYGGDFDCDGQPDLPPTDDFLLWQRYDGGCEEGSRLSLLYRDASTGLFMDPVPVVSTCDLDGSPLLWSAPWDLDGDGREDLVFADIFGTVRAMTRADDRSWNAPVELLSGDELWLRGTGDLDGNGELDLILHPAVWLDADTWDGSVLLNPLSNPVRVDGAFALQRAWFPRMGDGFFPEIPSVARDLNGDGCVDLALTAYTGGNQAVRVADGNCDGTFGGFRNAATAPAAQRGMELFDVDEDGDFDLWTSSDDDGDPGQTYWFSNDGSGSFGGPQTFIDFLPQVNSGNNEYESPGMCRPTELNGDGFVDLVCTWGGYLGADWFGGVRFGDLGGNYAVTETPLLNPDGWFPPGCVGPLSGP